MLDELKPIWIDSADGVKRIAEACAAAGRLALDTEADSMHSYFHKVCLVQVTAADRTFVVDPLALKGHGLDPLWRVVANPAMPVLMHGADYDVRVLDRDYGVRIGGLLDTQIMAQLLGEERTGLAFLLEREIGVELDKKHQRADWGRRPLKPELLAYAAADTAYLEELVSRLRGRLEELGRWSWAMEDCDRLARVRHEAPAPDPLAFERFKGARRLKGAARDRLFDLHQWRDDEARAHDLPPFKVLGNKPMLELAQAPPESLAEMAGVPGLGHRFVRRWGKQVMVRLRRPEQAPPRQRPNQAPGPNALERRRIQRLIAARDEVAQELGIQAGLLCPRATIQAVAASDGRAGGLAEAGLTGWRARLLEQRFQAALAEGA
jgi:ribonuclease D